MATATAAAATTAKGAECRAQLLASLKRVYEVDWGSPALGDVGIVLSGGVDTCAMMEALRELGLMPKTAFTVFCDASATDRPYAGAIAKAFGVGQHHQIDTTKEELLRAPLALGVSALRSFDPMELRNSIVVGRALSEAKALGVKYLLTGDGADELLGGYSFTHSSQDPVWSEKRADMCGTWSFSAPVMGEALGIKVASPYTAAGFKQWALASTSRNDCIGDRSQEVSPGGERSVRVAGKLPLRDAYPSAFSADRRKDPIEVGSGSTVLGAEQGKFFADLIPAAAFLEEKAAIAEALHITIRDPEHLFYFRVFRDVFGKELALAGSPGQKGGTGDAKDEEGQERQVGEEGKQRRLPERDATLKAASACVACHFELAAPSSNFCRVCGQWPAQRASTSTDLLVD